MASFIDRWFVIEREPPPIHLHLRIQLARFEYHLANFKRFI